MSELAYTPQLANEPEEHIPTGQGVASYYRVAPGAGVTLTTTATPAPSPTSLAHIRDLLLSVVHIENGKHPDLMLQIVVEYVVDRLVVWVSNNARKHSHFAITRREIEDRSYLSSFIPNLQRIIAEVQ